MTFKLNLKHKLEKQLSNMLYWFIYCFHCATSQKKLYIGFRSNKQCVKCAKACCKITDDFCSWVIKDWPEFQLGFALVTKQKIQFKKISQEPLIFPIEIDAW